MECRFCNIVNNHYKYEKIDIPFAQNDDFFAIASIGSMIEGWSLIIPKNHTLSMRNFYKTRKLENFINELLPRMHEKYGKIIAFEHGSNKEGSITACGTDHAHLHLVPFKSSLFEDLDNSDLKWEKCASSEIEDKIGNNEYLFYTELDINNLWETPTGYLHILEAPISQFFRHLLAQKIDKIDQSDYRRFLFLDNAERTRQVLSA